MPSRPPKQTIPHPSESRSELDHVRAVTHVMEQVRAGHYVFRQTKVTQGAAMNDGGVPFSVSTVRYETNPRNEAEPCSMDDLRARYSDIKDD